MRWGKVAPWVERILLLPLLFLLAIELSDLVNYALDPRAYPIGCEWCGWTYQTGTIFLLSCIGFSLLLAALCVIPFVSRRHVVNVIVLALAPYIVWRLMTIGFDP